MKDSIIWVDATDMLVSRVRSIPRPHSHLMFRNSSRKHMINLPLLSSMVVILTMTRRRANPKHLILTDLSSRDSRSWSRKPTKGILSILHTLGNYSDVASQWSCFVNRIHAAPKQKAVGDLLQTDKKASMSGEYLRRYIFPRLNYRLSIPQRRIKRKEYHTSAIFASDVELVFSNAMAFNQDHTPIWEDALALRVCLPRLLLIMIYLTWSRRTILDS